MPPKKKSKGAPTSAPAQDQMFDMAVSGQYAQNAMPSVSSLQSLMSLAEIAKSKKYLAELGLDGFVDEEFEYMKQAASIIDANPHLKYSLGCSGMPLVALVAARLKDRAAEAEANGIIDAGVQAMRAKRPSPFVGSKAIGSLGTSSSSK